MQPGKSEADMAVLPGSADAIPPAEPAPTWKGFGVWFIRALPFLILGIGAVVGMGWTTVTGQPKEGYWMIFTPVSAVICIVEGYQVCKSTSDWIRLGITQIVQWAAIGIAMVVLMLTPVRGLMNDDAVGLVLLTFIALGVFLSGLHERVWRLCVLGVFMGIAVPTLAWIESAVLLMAGILVVVCLAGVGIWWVRRR
jgi:hypothetical protein